MTSSWAARLGAALGAQPAIDMGVEMNARGRDDGFFDHREPFFFDYVEHELIGEYGAEAVRSGVYHIMVEVLPPVSCSPNKGLA